MGVVNSVAEKVLPVLEDPLPYFHPCHVVLDANTRGRHSPGDSINSTWSVPREVG